MKLKNIYLKDLEQVSEKKLKYKKIVKNFIETVLAAQKIDNYLQKKYASNYNLYKQNMFSVFLNSNCFENLSDEKNKKNIEVYKNVYDDFFVFYRSGTNEYIFLLDEKNVLNFDKNIFAISSTGFKDNVTFHTKNEYYRKNESQHLFNTSSEKVFEYIYHPTKNIENKQKSATTYSAYQREDQNNNTYITINKNTALSKEVNFDINSKTIGCYLSIADHNTQIFFYRIQEDGEGETLYLKDIPLNFETHKNEIYTELENDKKNIKDFLEFFTLTHDAFLTPNDEVYIKNVTYLIPKLFNWSVDVIERKELFDLNTVKTIVESIHNNILCINNKKTIDLKNS